MRTLIITILITLFSVLVLWGIGTAAESTHTMLGDADYIPFIQEIF